MVFFNYGFYFLIVGNIKCRGGNEKIVICNYNVNGRKLLFRKVYLYRMNMGDYI